MSLQARIKALEIELQVLSTYVAKDEQARQYLYGITLRATPMLEKPSETIFKLLYRVTSLSNRKNC